MFFLHFPCPQDTKHVGFKVQIYENPAKKRIFPQEDASMMPDMELRT